MSKGIEEKVAGVILAAGGSSRFGRPKQLLPWGEQNFVNTVLQTARLVGLDPLIIVLGNCADVVRTTIQDEDVQVLLTDWKLGQLLSQIGCNHLGRYCRSNILII